LNDNSAGNNDELDVLQGAELELALKTFLKNWTDDRVWMQECGSRFLPAWYSFDQEDP
jgi:hypothetical protein